MTRKVTSFQMTDADQRKFDALEAAGFGSRTDIIRIALDRMYQQESKMKHIKVGEVNDLSLYAVEVDGRYYPLNDKDLDFERPDAKIYYDSGLYPGIDLAELPQYICGKASE